MVLVHRLNFNFLDIYLVGSQVVTSNTGPILVFPRIKPYGSDEFSSLGKVYSRQATEFVNCENSSVSFVIEVLSDFNCCQESCISAKFNHAILLW